MKKFNKNRISILMLPVILLSCSPFFSELSVNEATALKSFDQERKQTVMMYMAADNALEAEALKDINELETLNLQKSGVTVICLVDRSIGYDGTNGDWTESRLYEITYDEEEQNGFLTSKEITSKELALTVGVPTELDMSNPNNLKNFLQFCMNNYQAESYALIIWGHGNGWRSVTSDSYTNTTMQLSDLRQAIELGLMGNNLDVLAFDTSFGGTLETAWELKNMANYFVGSPGVLDIAGWNYKNIFSQYLKTNLSTADFLNIVKKEVGSVCLDTNSIQNIKQAFDELTYLLATLVSTSKIQHSLLDILFKDVVSHKASTYPSDMFIDIYDFATNISKNVSLFTNDTALQQSLRFACENVHLSFQPADNFDSSPSMSVFFISLIAESVPDSLFPSTYITQEPLAGKLSIIQEGNGWAPSEKKNITLLDKLFFATY